MTDFEVRPITEDERRPTLDVLGRALLDGGVTDEFWDKAADSWPAEHKFGAFDGGVPIGIVSSFDTEIAVPGGNRVPAGAVEGVGVRADRTRRGVLTAMMRAQLDDLTARGFPLACLHASEPTIYGRFGYGVGALGKTVSITRPAARLHDALLPSGEVRLLTAEEAVEQIPALYHRIGLHRPGMIGRPEVWWPITHNRHVRAHHRVVVHSGPDGDDGFASYETVSQHTPQDPYKGALLNVRELHAANDTARVELWRYLLSVDLVGTVHARYRPVDEPVELMLTDPRDATTSSVGGDLWVRLLDVGAALSARTYRDAEPVVLDVTDRFLPANGGRYEVGVGGARRTEGAADLSLDVNVLAMLYLGGRSATALAQAGRITVHDAAAVSRADELFTTITAPWCGTYF